MHEAPPAACEITRKSKTPSTLPLSAPKNPVTSIICVSSPAQPSAKQPVNNERQLSISNNTIMPYSDMPIQKDSPVSYDDNIPPSEIFCKKKEGEAAKTTLPSSNVTCFNSIPPHLLTIWQAIESAYVPRETYHMKEKESQELASELAFTKSRVKELEQQLELSEAKRAESENLTSWAIEAVKNLEKGVESLKSDSNRICDKFIKDASDARAQMLSRMK